jgi:ATP-dependent RNA circularization protein (DNA/RNA ligase family)
MYAKHSIHYTDLESYFYVFSVWDEKNMCLPLTETRKFCKELGLTHVKVACIIEDFGTGTLMEVLESIYCSIVNDGQEGIVVRNVESYYYDDFQKNLAKAVRKDHVQKGAVHWATASIIPNLLKKNI